MAGEAGSQSYNGRRLMVIAIAAGVVLSLLGFRFFTPPPLEERIGIPMGERVVKSDDEWRKQLTPEQFRVTRQKGTERAFTGEYWNSKADGTFMCICCGQPLFDSKTK